MKKKLLNAGLLLLILVLSGVNLHAQVHQNREHLLMDFDWRFAYGHPFDTKKDFNNGTSYFSYFAKAGYGDGAAAADFDDRAWRKLDLPHDWAVEQGFSKNASFSHGFKAIGRNFPDASVGWYRKKFTIPASDFGRRIHLTFDGVFRNSIVWVNGHYLGNELSGYNGFDYDITEYLNYGSTNTVAVRVDATMEEGWFYEGAGIYRHVWLNKTAGVQVGRNGTFVTSDVSNNAATVTARATINSEVKTAKTVDIVQTVLDAFGKQIAQQTVKNLVVKPYKSEEVTAQLQIQNPNLWSVETPYLHQLITEVVENGQIIDRYTTSFGIRTIRFDANQGFFLNGKHVEIKGTNNHQDHAGVGSAIPDALQDFRIASLKAIGCNAYRCSHNPPTPELLDACDRLGMLVIDENRLMGITSTHFGNMKSLIERDRNHPSIISWSIGNEEWGIENSITGARIATNMQAYAKSLDSTRAITAAFSGGWGGGISAVMDLIGFNYLGQENPEGQHQKFPLQKSWGTEEGSTFATRGIYFNNDSLHLVAAYDKAPRPKFYSIESAWNYYVKHPFLAGMFIWTGFDYRGEPTPFGWPSVGSYFGMLDQCGFPKDDAWYLKAWWGDKPVLHLLPHWNWSGKAGQPIDVWAYSNCNEVELFLNGKSLGKKTMAENGHLEWKVAYQPGKLEAVGYKNGKKVLTDLVQTTGAPLAVQLAADRTNINADRQDLAIITVKTTDKRSMTVPTAGNEISFNLDGPGKIIGVGNGDPTSLEADKFLEHINTVKIENLKEQYVDGMENRPEVVAKFNDANWKTAFATTRNAQFGQTVKAIVYRGNFNLTEEDLAKTATFFYKSLGKVQSIYINGKQIAANIPQDKIGNEFKLDHALLQKGSNQIAVVAEPLIKPNDWTEVNADPGNIQLLAPASTWKRKLFSGLAQVIVQSTGKAGTITLTVTSPGLKPAVLKIKANEAKMTAHL